MKKYLMSLGLVLITTACGQSPSISVELPSLGIEPTTTIMSSSSSESVPVSFNLTYYQLTKIIATADAVSITGVGSCVVYISQTYCWDDGIKYIGFSSEFTFWGIDANKSVCVGNCETDLMANNPIRVTNTITSLINTMNSKISVASRRYVSDVLNSGTPKTVSCTESSGILNCGDFIVDLNQENL